MADQAQLLEFLKSISDRLARVEVAVSGGNGGGGGGASAAAVAPTSGGAAAASEKVGEFASFVEGPAAAWIAATKACGKKANKAANNMKSILDYMTGLVAKADVCRKPTDEEAAVFVKKMKDHVNKGLRAQFPDRNMEKGLTEVYNSLFAILHTKPHETIKEAFESMQFYTNKVLTDAKGNASKAANAAWVKASETLLTEFKTVTQGFRWRGKGDPSGDAPAAAAPAPAVAPVADTGGGSKAEEAAPAPAPTKKVNVAAAKGLSKGGGEGGLAGLFAELGSIDQSSGKTAGLKHVSDKQKAYKNRSLVKTSKVSDTKPKKKATKKAGAKPKKVLPPKCEYDKRACTHFVENQPDGARITVTVTDPNDKVYLYKCGDCMVVIEGRLKALNVVNCKKTQLSFQDLLAVVEVNNCESVKVQSLGKCPAMSIDKTNGCQVYLSRISLGCNFVCAQSSEMNVNWPTGPEGEEEEWLERPIPEQFQHKIVGTNLASEVSDLYSH